jgi:hypothetical protein
MPLDNPYIRSLSATVLEDPLAMRALTYLVGIALIEARWSPVTGT